MEIMMYILLQLNLQYVSLKTAEFLNDVDYFLNASYFMLLLVENTTYLDYVGLISYFTTFSQTYFSLNFSFLNSFVLHKVYRPHMTLKLFR